ncbi:MAG: sulfotransferase [Thermoanaerobaculia bacterium]
MPNTFRYFRWRVARIRLRIACAIARQFYRDVHGNGNKSILVAGAARSGTTWLAQAIRSQTPCRIMFEPFHPGKIEAYREFDYYQYVRPSEDHQQLFEYCQRLFKGEIRNPWVDTLVDVYRPQIRLVKAVRASFLLGWIHQRFPQVPILFLVRHPCAVVASRMENDWGTEDFAPCLQQEKLGEDYLGGKLEYLAGLGHSEEQHAALWGLHNMVALEHLAGGRGQVLFYEDLLLRPEEELPRIFGAISQPYDDSVFRSLREPSARASRKSAVVTGGDPLRQWQNTLSPTQIERVLSVVDYLGLSHLYGDSNTPLVSSRSTGSNESPDLGNQKAEEEAHGDG